MLIVVPAPARVEALCERLGALLAAHDVEIVTCDVRTLDRPDLGVVDLLARLQLIARRAGRTIRVRNAGPPLRGLIGLVGLTAVVPVDPGEARPDEGT